MSIVSNDLDIETWLDSDEGKMDGEGATVIVGRAQFFVGAMREFVGCVSYLDFCIILTNQKLTQFLDFLACLHPVSSIIRKGLWEVA